MVGFIRGCGRVGVVEAVDRLALCLVGVRRRSSRGKGERMSGHANIRSLSVPDVDKDASQDASVGYNPSTVRKDLGSTAMESHESWLVHACRVSVEAYLASPGLDRQPGVDLQNPTN